MSETTELKEHFEKLVSEQMSREANKPVSFFIGPKSILYKRSMKLLKGFLDSVDNELETAKAVMEVLFTEPRFNFKSRNSVGQLISDWDAGVSVVRQRQQEKAEEQKRRKVFEDMKNEQYKELFQ